MPRFLRIALLPLFSLPAFVASQTVMIRGRVLDPGSSTPVAAAAVRLSGTQVHAVTDSAGRFTMADVAPGEYTLEIEHVGYGKRTQSLKVPNTAQLQLSIEIDPRPVELGGITVKAVSNEERARRGEGTASYVITEDQIQAAVQKGRGFTDILRTGVPGLRISEGEFITNNAGSPARMLCVQAAGRGPPSYTRPARRQGGAASRYPVCDMIPVVLDGALLSDAGTFLYRVSLESFGRIEWLNGMAGTTRYGLQAQNKGVLVLQTRSGPYRRK